MRLECEYSTIVAVVLLGDHLQETRLVMHDRAFKTSPD